MQGFKLIKEVHSDKIRLKIVEKSDAEKIHLLRTNSDVAKFIHRDLTLTVIDIERFIEVRLQDFEIIWFYKIETIPDLELVGTIVLKNFDNKNSTAEIGYELFPQFQGQGLMSKALKIIIDMAFEELGLLELFVYTNKENLKSRRLVEKFDFKLTDKTDPNFANNVIYSLSRYLR
jgi:[ribosomal protein S5]-alanine N-acetyltransferase